MAAGSWAPPDSIQTSPPSAVPQQLPASVSYSSDDPLRVWQAWLSVDQLPDQAFLEEVVYDEAIYSDSQGALRFPFYAAKPCQEESDIEINTRYRHTDNSAPLSVTLPTS